MPVVRTGRPSALPVVFGALVLVALFGLLATLIVVAVQNGGNDDDDDGCSVVYLAVYVNSTNPIITASLLEAVYAVVEKQTREDFAPYYGYAVEITQYQLGQPPPSWENQIAVFISDVLTPDGIAFVGGACAFHSVQDSLYGNGMPVSFYLGPDTILLPEGLPYIVLPIGSLTEGYGLVECVVRHDLGTLANGLSNGLSHETLESLGDPGTSTYAVNASFPFPPPGPFPYRFDAFIREVCDPVEFGSQYQIDGFVVADFVLPSFWTANARSLGPFSFLGTVQQPLVPFAGEMGFYHFDPCVNGDVYIRVSPASDPVNWFDIDQGNTWDNKCVNGTIIAKSTPAQVPAASRMRVWRAIPSVGS